jgi:hypothetical protein
VRPQSGAARLPAMQEDDRDQFGRPKTALSAGQLLAVTA